jgi:hypothetical protein
MASDADFHFHPDLGLDAELAGYSHAEDIVRSVDTATRETVLTPEQRAGLVDTFAAGIAHFYSVAEQAGELAGSGDVIGAFALMGGVEQARELIGSEEVSKLLSLLDAGAAQELTGLE